MKFKEQYLTLRPRRYGWVSVTVRRNERYRPCRISFADWGF